MDFPYCEIFRCEIFRNIRIIVEITNSSQKRAGLEGPDRCEGVYVGFGLVLVAAGPGGGAAVVAVDILAKRADGVQPGIEVGVGILDFGVHVGRGSQHIAVGAGERSVPGPRCAPTAEACRGGIVVVAGTGIDRPIGPVVSFLGNLAVPAIYREFGTAPRNRCGPINLDVSVDPETVSNRIKRTKDGVEQIVIARVLELDDAPVVLPRTAGAGSTIVITYNRGVGKNEGAARVIHADPGNIVAITSAIVVVERAVVEGKGAAGQSGKYRSSDTTINASGITCSGCIFLEFASVEIIAYVTDTAVDYSRAGIIRRSLFIRIVPIKHAAVEVTDFSRLLDTDDAAGLCVFSNKIVVLLEKHIRTAERAVGINGCTCRLCIVGTVGVIPLELAACKGRIVISIFNHDGAASLVTIVVNEFTVRESGGNIGSVDADGTALDGGVVADKVTVVEGDGSSTGNIGCGTVFACVIIIAERYPCTGKRVEGLCIKGILGDIAGFAVHNVHVRTGVIDVDDSAGTGSVFEDTVTDIHGSAVEQGNATTVSGSLVAIENTVVQIQFNSTAVEADGRSIGRPVGAGKLNILHRYI